jgi:endonuclease/exonuclease/phosphatase family metal-dependent hydrolase
MSIRLIWIAVPLALAAAYAGAVFVVNRMALPAPKVSRVLSAQNPHKAPVVLTLCTWNIGYGGLGEESDFLSDGGTHLLPPSRRTVEKNLGGIKTVLKGIDADVYLFQEIAQPGLLTYGVDVQRGVEEEFPGFARAFLPDAVTRMLPSRYSVHHGLEAFSRYPIGHPEADLLQGENRSFFGLLRMTYGIARFEMNGENGVRWSIMTTHLAAFDDGAEARKVQLKQVIDRAVREYTHGAHVVVGGDWNLRMADTHFPNHTDKKYLFWVHDFPKGILPPGWRMVFDAKVPSVRTNYQPYRAGDNYVTVIDAFLVSPNVKVVGVEGVATGFRFADHQPVLLKVAADTK